MRSGVVSVGSVQPYQVGASYQFAPTSVSDMVFCQSCGTVVHIMLMAAHACPPKS